MLVLLLLVLLYHKVREGILLYVPGLCPPHFLCHTQIEMYIGLKKKKKKSCNLFQTCQILFFHFP